MAIVSAFGWNAVVIDGADMTEIDKTLAALPEVTLNGKPTAIISNTIKGQGSFMSDRPAAWHIGGFDDDKRRKRKRVLLSTLFARLKQVEQ